VRELLWPESRAFEALQALARDSGLLARGGAPSLNLRSESIPIAAASVGIEAEPVEVPYSRVDQQIGELAPALARTGEGYLAICADGKILAPGGAKHRISPAQLRSILAAELEAPHLADIEDVLQQAHVPPVKQARARDAILGERIGPARIRDIWTLRLPPGSDFRRQLRRAGVTQRLAALAVAHAVQYALWIVAWWIIGKNILTPGADRSWLLAWALILLALVPLRVAITWLQGKVAIGAGTLLKRRLFYGALRLHPDSIRHQGAGQLLGRVIESEAVEALALSGGFLGLVAIIELLAGLVVLFFGAAGWLHSLLLAVWIAGAAWIGRYYFRRNRAWTDVRLDITHDLVESMVGHRTRLAQLSPDRWHDGEDQALRRYAAASLPMDHATTALLAVIPRGWLIAGLLALIPAYAHSTKSTAAIAIAIGGILLAYRALKRLTAGAWQLAGAAVAWQRVTALYDSATRPELRGSRDLVTTAPNQPVVDASDLEFRYSDRTAPVLHSCSLQLRSKDRVVLEGASGGGKSTLVSLIAGLREPNSGRLLVDGLDRQTLGLERWIARVATAPQFHENHVLAETFAFNLLMGRHRVPTPADLDEATDICNELGLGDLLERMPAGMLQMVGETGWQLSHGERSRLYIARALLQNSELVILDESFAALDPENLQRCIECVVRRARSLLVVAHR